MWPKPSRKKGKSQGTKSRLKAIKEENSDESEEKEEKTSRSERRKTRPPNRNRSKRTADKERKRTGAATQNRLKKAVKKSQQKKALKKTKIDKKVSKQKKSQSKIEAEPNPPQPKEEENVAEEIGAVWKDKILEAYKGNPKNSHSLLKNVPNQRAQFEAGERQKLELIEESMIKVVDKMFDNFQNTAYGFNQVTQGSDLELVWIRPSFVTEESGNWTEGTGECRIFTGRISTRYWTLVIRGSQNSIVSFILPSDKLLSFGQGAFDYDPYVELVPVSDGMSVSWTVMGHEITQDLFPNVFRALLDGLIRFANEEAEEDEAFRLEDIGIVVEGAQQKETVEEPVDRFESDDAPELLSFEDTVEEPQPPPEPEPQPQPQQPVPNPQQQPASGPRSAPVEMAIEMAFEAAQHKAESERQEVVDPGAGFIQGISSALASEATEETDKLRESIQTAEEQIQSEPVAPEVAGQWKMVGANLPPAVASQWENYVKKTSDEVGPEGAPTQIGEHAGSGDDDDWNMIPNTQNLKPAQTVPADMPMPVHEEGPPQMQPPAPQMQPPPPQQMAAGGDQSGWVHPSQQYGDVQQQYNSGAQAPVPDPDQPYEHPEAYPRQDDYDEEETLEFRAPTGHSQFLLTEDDVDDRAIQTPPPDPDMAPPQMAPQQVPQQIPQQIPHQVEPEVEEEVVYEEEVEYVEDGLEEEVEYEEEIEQEYRPRGLVGALSEVVDTIDMKVERLSQKGQEAFANKDFKRAEVIIKLSERLNEFKNEANQLLSILGQEEDN